MVGVMVLPVPYRSPVKNSTERLSWMYTLVAEGVRLEAVDPTDTVAAPAGAIMESSRHTAIINDNPARVIVRRWLFIIPNLQYFRGVAGNCGTYPNG